MKFLVLFLGSTTLVAGGTAITPQQDVRNNVITNQRPHQEHRFNGSEGACCFQDTATCVDDLNSIDCLDQGGAWQGWTPCSSVLCLHECENAGIFSNIAKPIALNCAPFGGSFYGGYGPTFLDLDGDGEAEKILGLAELAEDEVFSWNNTSKILRADNASSFSVTTLLDIHPSVLTYEGLADFGLHFNIHGAGYLDVNGDDLFDQLLSVQIGSEAPQFFYVENISTPPAAVCASDINNDDVTDVVDLLEVVGNWGPCE
jgi:hypothetical protein